MKTKNKKKPRLNLTLMLNIGALLVILEALLLGNVHIPKGAVPNPRGIIPNPIEAFS